MPGGTACMSKIEAPRCLIEANGGVVGFDPSTGTIGYFYMVCPTDLVLVIMSSGEHWLWNIQLMRYFD